MKAVIQRVKATSLSVDGKIVSAIDFGLTVFLGIKCGDTEEQAEKLARKIAALRIFKDDAGKLNLSVKDVGGQILLVSNFTLNGDCSRGNRPDFRFAERPERANELYEYCAAKLREQGIIVKQGVFGANMQIAQSNDGPINIVMEL